MSYGLETRCRGQSVISIVERRKLHEGRNREKKRLLRAGDEEIRAAQMVQSIRAMDMWKRRETKTEIFKKECKEVDGEKPGKARSFDASDERPVESSGTSNGAIENVRQTFHFGVGRQYTLICYCCNNE
jgi:hypothetical protein